MRGLKRAFALSMAGAALCAGAVSAQTQNDGPPLEFNYGMPSANHASIYVAQDLNLFAKVGLKPKFLYFQSGAPLLAGLKAEGLDVVTAGLAVTFALGGVDTYRIHRMMAARVTTAR